MADIEQPTVEPTVEAPAEAPAEAPKPVSAREMMQEAVQSARRALDASQPAAETPAEVAPEAPEPAAKVPYSWLKGDTEVEAPSDLADLKVRYKAKGKQHDSSLEDLIRRAQQYHGIEGKIEELRTQRDSVARDAQALETEIGNLRGDRELLLSVLRDESGEAFKKLQQEFMGKAGESDGAPSAPRAEPEPAAPGAPTAEQQQAAGVQVIESTVLPWAETVAAAYGGEVDHESIVQVALEMLAETPARFVSLETFAEILNERIPEMLEAEGFQRVGDFDPIAAERLQLNRGSRFARKATSEPEDVEALRQRVTELEAQLSSKSTEETIRKVVEAPPSAASEGAPVSSAVAGATLDLSKAKSKEDVKQALRDLRAQAYAER